jgi:hypothetical protein
MITDLFQHVNITTQEKQPALDSHLALDSVCVICFVTLGKLLKFRVILHREQLPHTPALPLTKVSFSPFILTVE